MSFFRTFCGGPYPNPNTTLVRGHDVSTSHAFTSTRHSTLTYRTIEMELAPHPVIPKKKPVLVCILDGWGVCSELRDAKGRPGSEARGGRAEAHPFRPRALLVESVGVISTVRISLHHTPLACAYLARLLVADFLHSRAVAGANTALPA